MSLIAAALTVAAVALGVLAAPANAATHGRTQPLGHKVTAGMTAHQVVSTTPNAAGGVLTLDNGKKLQLTGALFQTSQATSRPTYKAALATPFGTGGVSIGNCGSSWINYDASATRTPGWSPDST